ncbi:MAG: ABC transporter ATP-binding protein [Rhodospirillaceae bacterium]|nr:ABC transporter ATP-binding protein [Rhodospirillaceae bacterium]
MSRRAGAAAPIDLAKDPAIGEPLLSVRDLSVEFAVPGSSETVPAVKKVSFDIARGETVALVGESGSGKSVTALSVLQLLPYPAARHPGGSIRFAGEELMGASDRKLRQVRGNRVSMVFQEPMTSLNPLHSIERQVGEVLQVHKGMSPAQARGRVLELLRLVGLANPEQRLGAYPHELSGGQRQRVMIAMALANEPDLLIADEPTTALDVTIQAQILELLNALRHRFGMAMLLITHDLGIVRKMADRVCVMTEGEIVETAPTAAVFASPQHPYTRRLLDAEPRGEPVAPPADAKPLMEATDLKVWFPIKKGLARKTVDHIRAVDGVTLSIKEGQTIGVVGESGSGKTTLGLALLRLISSVGSVRFDGRELQGQSFRQLRPLRKDMQIVFQDPYGSLSPRMSVAQIVAEGLLVHTQLSAEERDARICAALDEVGIDPNSRFRYPHEFSGGQRQRIAIARAVVLNPRLVVLDEPTSALDRSVQAAIVELLRKLQRQHRLAYLFISHDLKVVRAMSDHVLVMKDGRLVEQGNREEIFQRPRDPYTQELLRAALDLETSGAANTTA